MAPKGQSFEVPMRESKQLTSSKVSERQRKRSLKKVPGKKTEEKPTEEEELDISNDSNLTTKYVAVSPGIFRRNIFHTNRLQREIIVGRKGSFKAIEFDPALQRKAPIYLDIPNLYARKRSAPTETEEETKTEPDTETEKKERKRYKYEAKEELPEAVKPRYVYIARPATPKNYNPRPKSSKNRYVFVGVKPRYKEVSFIKHKTLKIYKKFPL